MLVNKLLSNCPSCGGGLKITVLTCPDCGMELRGEFERETDFFSGLSSEHKDFLIAFLRCRGNMSRLQEELKISYPAAKKRMNELLVVLELNGEENKINTRSVIDVSNWNVDKNSKKASDIVKQKLKEGGGRATVTSYSGNEYEVWAEMDGESFGCDALPICYKYDIFDIVVDFLKENGGRAKKGTGRAPLGSEKCGVNTVAGVILRDYWGVSLGGSGLDPSFAVIAILNWAGLIRSERGYVELTGVESEKEISLSDVEKLELQFEEELRNKMFLAKKECNYNPTRFNQMLDLYGGVETAKRLVQDSMQNNKVSDGFTRLFMEKRPDLTAEDSVCKPEYADLFTTAEINFCKELLKK